jgi:hypothetical protein
MVAVAMAVSEGWCSTDLLLVSTSGDLDITSPFYVGRRLGLGDVAQSMQITFHLSSFPIAIADVLKRNLIILNYVPTVRQTIVEKLYGASKT